MRHLLLLSLLALSFVGCTRSSEQTSGEGSLAAATINRANWMGDNQAILGPKKLNETAMVGAHDAGTYTITSSSAFAPDRESNFFWETARSFGVIDAWARTQNRNVLEMLNDGVRYFDIRVCVDRDGALLTCHTLFGDSIENILNYVKTFTDQHPKEVVILGFTHFWDYQWQAQQTPPKAAGESQGITTENFRRLLELVKSTLGNKLVPNAYTPESTFSEVWSGANETTSNQVITSFDYTYGFEDPIIWNDADVGNWISAKDVNEFKAANLLKIQAQATGAYAGKFFSIRSSVTPDGQMIGRAFIPGEGDLFPNSVMELADMTNPVVWNWVRTEWSGYTYNILQGDFYNRSNVVELALSLNGIPDAQIRPELYAARSSWHRWNCPANYRDDGLYCAKPAAYTRQGYPWEFGDTAFSLDDARARCRSANPQGCEKVGEIIYPLCRAGYYNVACCICSPSCPAGMTDIGVSCRK